MNSDELEDEIEKLSIDEFQELVFEKLTKFEIPFLLHRIFLMI